MRCGFQFNNDIEFEESPVFYIEIMSIGCLDQRLGKRE